MLVFMLCYVQKLVYLEVNCIIHWNHCTTEANWDYPGKPPAPLQSPMSWIRLLQVQLMRRVLFFVFAYVWLTFAPNVQRVRVGLTTAVLTSCVLCISWMGGMSGNGSSWQARESALCSQQKESLNKMTNIKLCLHFELLSCNLLKKYLLTLPRCPPDIIAFWTIIGLHGYSLIVLIDYD